MSVGPKGAASMFPINPTEASKAGRGFTAANGTAIKNYGERVIRGVEEGGINVKLPIQVADVQKILVSVDQMNEMGNQVVLNGTNSYIENTKTKQRTRVKKVGRNFVFSI